MMRIRTVKPSLFLHGDLFDLEAQLGLPVRLAYIGLFCAADREGRFEWKPRELKIQILPYDDGIDFSRVLNALVTRGFLVRYTNGMREYGWIPTFKAHQVVNNKEKASILPDPHDANSSFMHLEPSFNNLTTRESRDAHASTTPLFLDQGEGKGIEGNRREGNVVGEAATAAETFALDFGDEEPSDPNDKKSPDSPSKTNVNFQVVDELAKDSTLRDVLKNISTDVQKKWLDRYEATWLSRVLLNAIHYHLEKENALNPSQINDWGLRLGKWLRREKKPHLLEHRKNLAQEIEEFEAQISKTGGSSHEN